MYTHIYTQLYQNTHTLTQVRHDARAWHSPAQTLSIAFKRTAAPAHKRRLVRGTSTEDPDEPSN